MIKYSGARRNGIGIQVLESVSEAVCRGLSMSKKLHCKGGGGGGGHGACSINPP